MVFLLLGAVLDEQLARTKGIGYAHRHHERLVGCQFLQNCRLRLGREFEATVFLGNDHPEETFLLEEVPQLFGQISPLDRHVPGVTHGNCLDTLIVDEGLFFLAQAGIAVDQQVVPVRPTSEQFTVPADRTGFESHFLSLGNLRCDLLEHRENAGCQPALAKPGEAGSSC